MKFAISLVFLLMSHLSWGYPIRIFHEGMPENATLVKEIMMNEYHIPEELFSLIKINNCDQLSGARKFDLCINSEAKMLVISVDRTFTQESLKVFRVTY